MVANVTGASNNVNAAQITDIQTQRAEAEENLWEATEAQNDAAVEAQEAVEATKTPQEELEELQAKKQQIMENIEATEAEIERLAQEAEDKINEAIEMQGDIVTEYKEQAEQAVKENLANYIEANKNGEGMTKDQLSEAIAASIPAVPGLGEAVAKLVEANEQISQIDGFLGKLNSFVGEVSNIDAQIDAKTAEVEQAQQAAQKCCDPIGFQTSDGSTYDFIVDDGNFDSTSDFLGAGNQWEEMVALDKDKNGTVDSEELKEGNIKAVKRDKDGNQTVVDLADTFGDKLSIDLSTYDTKGTHSAIDTAADFDADGVADQNLLGTFTVNIGDEALSGYNTLDDVDWLSSTFGVTAAAAAADGAEATVDAMQEHTDFIARYTQVAQDLRAKLNSAYAQFGISEDLMDDINEVSKKEADVKIENFFAEKEAKEAKEAEETEKAEEAEEAKEAEEAEEEKEAEEEQQLVAA